MRKKHTLVIGKIVMCDKGGKGNFGPSIFYEYKVDSTLRSASRRHGKLVYSIRGLENHLFPVVYAKNWWGYSETILMTPDDFTYYGYTFPDSLNWILQYMKQ